MIKTLFQHTGESVWGMGPSWFDTVSIFQYTRDTQISTHRPWSLILLPWVLTENQFTNQENLMSISSLRTRDSYQGTDSWPPTGDKQEHYDIWSVSWRFGFGPNSIMAQSSPLFTLHGPRQVSSDKVSAPPPPALIRSKPCLWKNHYQFPGEWETKAIWIFFCHIPPVLYCDHDLSQ